MEKRPTKSQQEITLLLQKWSGGDPAAGNRLFDIVYTDLRKIAGGLLAKERPEFGLRTRELIHESYLRLVDQKMSWENRQHFFAVAAKVIRRIIVDHVRHHSRKKRGGDAVKINLDLAGEPAVFNKDWLALDEALDLLSKSQPLGVTIFELHYFAGLTYEEIASSLGVSRATANRHLRTAEAFLQSILKKDSKK